ncbi:3-carboxyethylcatechol 2,3-dioxygenase [Luteococcus sp. Sow4_B9]|uniref:3-carboxyethylcatechol 2,3-dioxygenase n=1 Tax=Luteococcus sp. Sow4_B9 TaxID=3438792 RepID=UPI003F9BEE80
MPAALVAMSHSPLIGFVDVPEELKTELDGVFDTAKKFVKDFDPTLVINFAPDHYNGFFYDTMPPFCVGLRGFGLGDYDTAVGDLDVPTEKAEELVRFVQEQDVDMCMSRYMGLDHGAVQPMEILFGGIDTVPTIPVFVNGVAGPFVPMRRIRAMGEAIGRWATTVDERVLLIASGGLSHDPPVPQWATASEDVRKFLLDGRNPTPEARQARQERVINAAKDFVEGKATIRDLNPEWDQDFMKKCATHDVAGFDAMLVDEMVRDAGNSSHEVRTWVSAFSAFGAIGDYQVDYEYYREIKHYIAGFGVMTANQKA